MLPFTSIQIIILVAQLGGSPFWQSSTSSALAHMYMKGMRSIDRYYLCWPELLFYLLFYLFAWYYRWQIIESAQMHKQTLWRKQESQRASKRQREKERKAERVILIKCTNNPMIIDKYLFDMCTSCVMATCFVFGVWLCRAYIGLNCNIYYWANQPEWVVRCQIVVHIDTEYSFITRGASSGVQFVVVRIDCC